MAFPVEEGMDRVVATPLGQTPPVLGSEIYEDPDLLRRRRKGAKVDWNIDETYTFCLWSAYVDFLEWRCINLPGIRPFDLANVIGPQHLNLTLYDIEENSERHYQSKMTNIVRIEMSNAIKSNIGPIALDWTNRKGRDATNVKAALDESNEFIREEEEEKYAELGEGMYIRSGDSICLRELRKGSSQDLTSRFVTYAGGFAVLQDNTSAAIVIEKVERSKSKSKKKKRTRLIHTGDTVLFKLITHDSADDRAETLYLTIHRGWWLKWSTKYPNKNGFFTIHTHETEGYDTVIDGPMPAETQASYLTLGGSIRLQHKRWRHQVGVAKQDSATYGGRMLGLYAPRSDNNTDEIFNDIEDETDLANEDVGMYSGKKARSDWLRPLQFQVCEFSPLQNGSLKAASEEFPEETTTDGKLLFSDETMTVDVPVWIEMLNRKERIIQLAYVVRVSPQYKSNEEMSREGLNSFFRLRTGPQLSHLMRAGLKWRSTMRSQKQKNPVSSTSMEDNGMRDLSDCPASPKGCQLSQDDDDLQRLSSHSNGDSSSHSKMDESVSIDEWAVESCDDEDVAETAPLSIERSGSNDRPAKSRKIIGKLARKTASTGKTVVKQSVKVGKGTVNLMAPRPKNPPSREPKGGKKSSRKTGNRNEKDLRISISRSMRRKGVKKLALDQPSVLAGELTPPEQSCRTVSSMLALMSSQALSSDVGKTFSNLLASELGNSKGQEDRFLSGGATQMGVIPGNGSEEVLADCIVARCLWESHWREEWCCLTERGIQFYAPLTNSPCLELSKKDVRSVRRLTAGDDNPFPGYPLLVIETAWQCYYVSFDDEDTVSAFTTKLEDALSKADQDGSSSNLDESILWEARFWQGFQDSLRSSSGRGKWADLSSGNSTKSTRVILNNRRMVFDLPKEPENIADFVANLLNTALSFSQLGRLKENPDLLISFLDSTSQLRRIQLQDLDRVSAESFCIFVNLYHWYVLCGTMKATFATEVCFTHSKPFFMTIMQPPATRAAPVGEWPTTETHVQPIHAYVLL